MLINGLSERSEGVGRLVGYGVFNEQGVSLSVFMPINMKQTNNAAELIAALRAPQLHPIAKIAICSDSEYIMLGVRAARKRWINRGWVGLCSPVSDVPI